MKGHELNILEKRLRTIVIKRHMERLGIRRAICFTSGNAGKEMIKAGIEGTVIGRGQHLDTDKWWTQEEIALAFPGHFNATSGDLSIPLMEEIATLLARTITYADKKRILTRGTIYTGSGETALVWALAFPNTTKNLWLARNEGPETQSHPQATLNAIIDQIYPGRTLLLDGGGNEGEGSRLPIWKKVLN